MFFHQYFLATRVDVLWKESAWKKQKKLNKSPEMEEVPRSFYLKENSTDFHIKVYI